MDIGHLTLDDVARWTLYVGIARWTLGVARWTLNVGRWTVGPLDRWTVGGWKLEVGS